MKLCLRLGKLPWNVWCSSYADPPHVKKLRDRFHELFAAYEPRRVCEDPANSEHRVNEITVEADDPRVEKLLQKFDKELKQSKKRAAATISAAPTSEETNRVRFLKLVIYGEPVDQNARYEPLNPPKRVLCDVCRFPDITQVPEPLLVSKAVLKKQDVFRVSTGMLLVRPSVLELLNKAIGNQIEVGEARIAGAKQKPNAADRLFWVRPKEMIGDVVLKSLSESCPRCKRVLCRGVGDVTRHIQNRGPGLLDLRGWVEHFGTGKADFAVLGGFNGRFRDGQPSWHWEMAVSGALFDYLKSNGVKGIAASFVKEPPYFYFSAKGDPTLEPQPRSFGEVKKTARASKADQRRSEPGRKALAALKDVPWDCKDGFVYFWLTTPELMVLDPMTWEEDTSGPHRVKKFTKPGLYRMPVSAIKDAEGKDCGVAVDSGTLLLVDNAAFGDLQDAYDWNRATTVSGSLDRKYHDTVAQTIGSRFGICTTPARKFKSEFVGDGFYTLDARAIERVK